MKVLKYEFKSGVVLMTVRHWGKQRQFTQVYSTWYDFETGGEAHPWFFKPTDLNCVDREYRKRRDCAVEHAMIRARETFK